MYRTLEDDKMMKVSVIVVSNLQYLSYILDTSTLLNSNIGTCTHSVKHNATYRDWLSVHLMCNDLKWHFHVLCEGQLEILNFEYFVLIW